MLLKLFVSFAFLAFQSDLVLGGLRRTPIASEDVSPKASANAGYALEAWSIIMASNYGAQFVKLTRLHDTGFDFNQCVYGRSLLDHSYSRGNLPAFEFLLVHGQVDPEGKCKLADGNLVEPVQTPMMRTCRDPRKLGRDAFSILVENGASVTSLSEKSQGPFHVAAKSANVGALQQLLEISQEGLDAKDERGQTPLHLACGIERDEIDTDGEIKAARILESNINTFLINDRMDRTIELLLDFGADAAMKDNNGMTPADLYAKQRQPNKEISCRLSGTTMITPTNTAETVEIDDLMAEIVKGNSEKAVELIDHLPRSKLDLCAASGSLLQIAAHFQDLTVARALLEKGANPNLADCEFSYGDKKSMSPISIAATKGHTRLVKLLAMFGANVSDKLSASDSPLHVAASNGHADVVIALLERGAIVNAIGDMGRTPLHLAYLNRYDSDGQLVEAQQEVIDTLLSMGADQYAEDVDGLTPLDLDIRDEWVVLTFAPTTKGASDHENRNSGSDSSNWRNLWGLWK